MPGTHKRDRDLLPEDSILAREGGEIFFRERAVGRVLVIACGALAREILALIELGGLRHVDLACLPALLHNTPDKIPAALKSRIRRAHEDGYETVLAAYADCGTGGAIDRVCEEEGVERIAGPHCYAFYDGLKNFEFRADEEIGAFYLTDFLVRQFDTIVWKGLGLDRHPELRDEYFKNYDRVVYLAQTDNLGLDRKAGLAAERLGLEYVRRFAGYGELETFLHENVPAESD